MRSTCARTGCVTWLGIRCTLGELTLNITARVWGKSFWFPSCPTFSSGNSHEGGCLTLFSPSMWGVRASGSTGRSTCWAHLVVWTKVSGRDSLHLFFELPTDTSHLFESTGKNSLLRSPAGAWFSLLYRQTSLWKMGQAASILKKSSPGPSVLGGLLCPWRTLPEGRKRASLV